jgi:hypothetical protein
MINGYRLALKFTSLVILGAAGLGASGCTVTATVSSDSCGTDSSVACGSGLTGYTCPADQAPEDTDSTIICSIGTDNGDGTASYCCGAAVAGTFGCASDTTLSCVSGTNGQSCYGGALPDSSSQICSDGTSMSDGSVGYCCAPFSGTTGTCAADPSVSGCQYPSYGISCASGDNPNTYDASLNCSQPTASGGEDLYCCQYGTTTTDTCAADSTLQCTGGSTGQSCTGSATPDTSSEACSIGTSMSDGSTGYCCISFTSSSSTCTPDETVTGCQYPSYGFSCATGDDPTTLDASLNCSQPTTCGTQDLFCCQ